MKRAILVCVLFLLASASSANQLVDVGPAEHAKRADVIVIGTFEAGDVPFKNNGRDARAAKFKVQAVLKGSTEGPSVLVPYLYASEASYACCDRKKQYMLFLYSPTDGVYFPVNGRFGVYEISGHPSTSDGKFPDAEKQ